jgi:hypothetical protein
MEEYSLGVFKNRALKIYSVLKVKKKGKVRTRTGHDGTEGEQRYSSTFSLTSALDVGGWSTPRVGNLTPGNDLIPIA